MAKDDSDSPADKTSRQDRLREAISSVRVWAAANRLRTVAVVGAAGVALAVTLLAWVFLAKSVVEMEEPPSLESALTALDEKRLGDARAVIRKLQELDRLAPSDYGGPMFILGAIKAIEASEETSVQRSTATHLIAARYLDEARARGFPEGRAEQGIFLLAKSLVASAQYKLSLSVVEEALAANPHRATEIHQLFADSLLGQPTPRLLDALAHNQAVLKDRLLPASDRAAVLLTNGEILIRLGRDADCRNVLENLPDELRERPEVHILKGLLRMEEGRSALNDNSNPKNLRRQLANQELQEAIDIFRQAQDKKTNELSLKRQTMYLIGLCYMEMDEQYSDAALDQLSRVRMRYSDTPEGLAASLGEADVLICAGRADEAVAAYRRTLEAAGEVETYRNRWVPLAEFQSRILNAHRMFVDSEQFDQAIVLLDGVSPIISPIDAERKRALTYRSWGDSMEERADFADVWEAPVLTRGAQRHYRHAGVVFERVAVLRFATRYYPDDLWEAASSYIEGHAYTPAARVLTKYLHGEATARRPQALVELGIAHLALGDPKRAVSVLEECIELHSHDAAIYPGRIACSQAYRELGNLKRAKELLLQNLDGESLSPSSPEWRDSLFEYGFIQHIDGVYDDAINTLTQAVERYENADQTVLARYLIANAYRQATRAAIDGSNSAQSKNERAKQLRLVKKNLHAAADQYHRVQQDLTNASAAGELDALGASILRNSYLMRGSVLFDLREYDQALEVFRNASSLYPSDPVVLETYVQIANCHRRMNRQLEARGALQQAKVVLRRIPPNADFALATNLSRADWGRLLDEMSTW